MGVYIWNKLPSEYQEVEYIGRNGNNYIDTGWIPKLTGGFTIKVGYKISTSSRRYAIIGNYNDRSNDISLEISNSNTARFYIQNTGSFNLYSSNTISTSSFNDITYTISTTSQSINLNGTTTSSSTSLPETNNTSCYLFIDRQKRWTTFTANSFISYCKIYESGTLVRDFIPCYRKSDNVIGLYDLVNNQFYTNSGSGTFSKGSDVNTYRESSLKNAYIGEVIPTNGLVARYKLDGNMNDSYGNNNLTLTSYSSTPTYITGKSGQALQTGAGYIYLSSGNIFTIRFFVKITTVNGQTIQIYETSACNTAGKRLDLLRTRNNTSGSTNGVCMANWNSGATSLKGAISSKTITDGNWHHIVCTRNGTAFQLFVDNTKITGTGNSDIANYLCIKGQEAYSVDSTIIDDVLVYNRVRTDEEVATDYNNFG